MPCHHPPHYTFQQDLDLPAHPLYTQWVRPLVTEKTINASNNAENTPLHLAYSNGRSEAGKVLIRCGANLDAINKKGKTPQNLALDNLNQKSKNTGLTLLEDLDRAAPILPPSTVNCPF